jgi:hypothetical protein
MCAQCVFPGISDWWNYSSSAGAGVAVGSLYEYLLVDPETGWAQENLGAEMPESPLDGGPIPSEIGPTAHYIYVPADRPQASAADKLECFASTNGK